MAQDTLERKLRVSRLINLVLAAALVVVGASYAALVWDGGNTEASPEADAPGDTAVVDDAPGLETAPYMVIGDADAPVVLYEWTDFTCPYCGLFHRDTLPTVIDEYVDTGKVRIEVHDVTFIGPQAEDAAVAARAAGIQDRYFDYLFAVYDLGRDGAKPDLNRDTLFGLAEGLGLDMREFEASFDGPDLRSQVRASTQLAQSLGIGGVPFFVGSVGGSLSTAQNMQGAQPIEQVRLFLDAFVAEAGA